MAAIEIVEAVRVESVIGRGIADDPMRSVVEWFLRDGTLLRRDDSWADEVKRKLADAIEIQVVDDKPERKRAAKLKPSEQKGKK